MRHAGYPPLSAIGNILTAFIAHLFIWWPMVFIGLVVETLTVLQTFFTSK